MDFDSAVPSGLLVVAASPSAHGTTALLSALIADGAGRGAHVCPLWDKDLRGCVDCGGCVRAPHGCVLADKDDCEDIFSAMLAAEHVVWVSPVYFYGLPAGAKALVDRGQRFYEARNAGSAAPGKGTMTAVFCAGRKEGQRLFDGSRLAVRYFAQALGLTFSGAYGLRGLSAADDVTDDLARALRDLGRAVMCGQPFASPSLEALYAGTALETARL